MGAGTRARAAAIESRARTGAEQLAALGGLCAFLAGFFAAGLLAPAALTSFWVWVALIAASIGVGAGVNGIAARMTDSSKTGRMP